MGTKVSLNIAKILSPVSSEIYSSDLPALMNSFNKYFFADEINSEELLKIKTRTALDNKQPKANPAIASCLKKYSTKKNIMFNITV